MTLLDILPRSKHHSHTPELEQVEPTQQIKPYTAVELGQRASFMPRDTRAGTIAAQAVTRYGAEFLPDEKKETDGDFRVRSLAEKVASLGYRATRAYDSTGSHDPTYSYDAKVAEERFAVLAEKDTLHGEEASVVLHSLQRLAESRPDSTAGSFDKVTAGIVLAETAQAQAQDQAPEKLSV